jgi:hypothetical protein
MPNKVNRYLCLLLLDYVILGSRSFSRCHHFLGTCAALDESTVRSYEYMQNNRETHDSVTHTERNSFPASQAKSSKQNGEGR